MTPEKKRLMFQFGAALSSSNGKMEFNPSRLALARKRRGLSKAALASQTGISVRSLGYYESKSSDITPSRDHQATLAQRLELPLDFFYGDDVEEIACDAASFRSLSGLSASQRDAALAAGTFAKMLSEWIEQRFELPTPSIPSLRNFEPEAAAQALRAEWGLGERPLSNTVAILEFHGVRVFTLPVDSRKVDAFSLWHEGTGTPFVFLNTKKSAEHSRFDACHELAHLTLHAHGIPRSREVELEADRFAGAFLMPRGDMLAHIPPARTITFQAIHKLKKRWGVSAIALVYRLHKLGILTDWQYRNLCIELSSAGYRSSEADGMERDSSQVFAKVFKALKDEGVTRGSIARDLALTTGEIDSLLLGLTIASVSQPPGPTPKPSFSQRRTKPLLRIV